MKGVIMNMLLPIAKKETKIYHYTSIAEVKGICEGEFWATECHFLNDSTEFQIGTEMFLKVMKKHILNEIAFKEFKARLEYEMQRYGMIEKEKNDGFNYYVVSFCTEKDSALMWSAYAGTMGYCMEFDIWELANSFGEDMMFHGNVVYDEKEQENYIEGEFKAREDRISDFLSADGEKIIDNTKLDVFIKEIAPVCLYYNMFFKRKCFEGEKEYRMVFPGIYIKNEVPRKYKPEFREKSGVLIPYMVKRIPNMKCLKSVVLGPQNKMDIAKKGLQWYFESQKMDIAISESSLPLRY